MSTTAKITFGVLIGLLVIGCIAIAAYLILRPGPEPEPTPKPTDVVVEPTEPGPTAPPEAGDDSWEKVKAAGKIVVGTAADYPPYEFYVDSGRIDGFDIAMMDEIGRRLGVQVEYLDFAFEGLGNALMLKQIDVALAAISVTPKRESEIDFGNVYLVGEDGILAKEDSEIVIESPGNLVGYRVGVQRGSVYESWLQEDYVDKGIMLQGNLFSYEKADDAIRDLQEDRVDLVILDSQVAQVHVDAGGVKIVGLGLNQQRLALAFPKGAQALVGEINKVLGDLHNEGVIAQLANQYLGLAELLPTPTPAPTSTPAPPPACVDGMSFVQHVGDEWSGVPVMQPGQPFTKIWRVKNTGTCTWDSSYRLVYVSGNHPQSGMGGVPTAIQGVVDPGKTYDIAVDMVAPLGAGAYEGFWQMENSNPSAFGQRLRVTIEVPGAPTATPAPTLTPAPGVYFAVDRNQITAGECVNFSWRVENVKEVYFYYEGQRWQDGGVVGEGTRKECPPVTLTYYLRVVKNDGTVEVPQLTINVDPGADAPYISRFTVDPAGQITLGQCVTVRWTVEGAINTVSLFANGGAIWEGAPTSGSYQDCPVAAGNVTYELEAVGPGGTSRQAQTIKVVDPATATPVPTAPPEGPVIHSFSVTPKQMVAGDCVGISWSIAGGTSYGRLSRNGAVIIDNAPFDGYAPDCLSEAGTYVYRLEAFNQEGESVSREDSVTVTEAASQNPLAGTHWAATAYYDDSVMQQVLEGTGLTIIFGDGGSLNGSAGCNTYSASYVVDGSSLIITMGTFTQMLCAEPEGIMDQEAAFIAALGTASSYTLEGGELYLLNASGQAIVESVQMNR